MFDKAIIDGYAGYCYLLKAMSLDKRDLNSFREDLEVPISYFILSMQFIQISIMAFMIMSK